MKLEFNDACLLQYISETSKWLVYSPIGRYNVSYNTFEIINQTISAPIEIGDINTPPGMSEEEFQITLFQLIADQILEIYSGKARSRTCKLDKIDFHFLRKLNDRGAIRNYENDRYPSWKKDISKYANHDKIKLDRKLIINIFKYTDLLRMRKSNRVYSCKSLDYTVFSQLLFETFYHNEKSISKLYPSGGATHSLELYLLCTNVDQINNGLYYYNQHEHELISIECDAPTQILLIDKTKKAQGILDGNPNVIMIICSRFLRTTMKYPDIGIDLILKEFGCLLFLIQQTCSVLNLNSCPVGGRLTSFVNKMFLQGEEDEIEIGSICIGT